MVNAMATAMQGIHSGLSTLNTAAKTVSSASLSGERSVIEPIAELKQAELQVAASAKVVQAINDRAEHLIDIFA